METGLIGAEYPLPMKQILLLKRQTPASNGKLTIEIRQFVTDLDSLTNNGQLRSNLTHFSQKFIVAYAHEC